LYRLQKFKLQTANTIISTENASLQSMGTEQVIKIYLLKICKLPLKSILFFIVTWYFHTGWWQIV